MKIRGLLTGGEVDRRRKGIPMISGSLVTGTAEVVPLFKLSQNCPGVWISR